MVKEYARRDLRSHPNCALWLRDAQGYPIRPKYIIPEETYNKLQTDEKKKYIKLRRPATR